MRAVLLMLLLTLPSTLRAQAMCAPSSSDLLFADGFGPAAAAAHAHHHDPELDAHYSEGSGSRTEAVNTSGVWSNPSTWGGTLPGANSDVMIPTGTSITLDINASVRSITVCGRLEAARRDTELATQWLMVMQRGEFVIGSAVSPFTQRFQLTLGPADPTASVMGMGTQLLGAMAGGKIRIFGEKRLSWTQLGASVGAGASLIQLKEPVDWRVGDEIVIASSSLEPAQAEHRTISAIENGGRDLRLNQALLFGHYGELQSFDGRTLDARAEVGLKSRRIVIQSDSSSISTRFGGHVMIMGSGMGLRESNPALRSSAIIQGVEFRRMGQFNRLGRYPIHWHFNDLSSGDTISHCSFHSNFQRGIVLHGSDGITVSNNVIAGSIGHAYVLEDGSERSNQFIRNLGLDTKPASFTASGLSNQNDQNAATFWFRTAAATVRGNSAAGGDFAGFWFDMGFVNGNNATKALLDFDQNTVHSYRTGGDTWAVWHTDGFVPSREGVLRFNRLTAYKNRKAIETAGRGVTENAMLADNIRGISNHLLRNSTLVSRSANSDSHPDWGSTGLFAYGGFANAENVGFVGFNNNRAIARTLVCGIEYPRFAVSGARMINSDPAAGCGDVLMSDLDGAFSGAPGPRRIVSVEGRPNWPSAGSNAFGLTTSACQIFTPGRPDGYAVCPNYDYRALGVTYPTGAGFANPDWRVDVVRTVDGVRQTPNHFRWAAYTIPGFSYALEVRNQRNLNDPVSYPLNSLAMMELGLSDGDFADPQLELGGRNLSYDPQAVARSVSVGAMLPAAGFRIRICARQTSCSSNPLAWPVLSAASSLASFNSSTRSAWIADPVNGKLLLRLFGGDRLHYQR